jgi:cell division protein FtsZ
MTSTFHRPAKPLSGRSQKRISMRIVGVGNAGANILSQLAVNAFSDGEIAFVNTDGESLDSCSAPHKFLLNGKLARGKNSESAITEHLPLLKKFFEGAEVIFVVVGLGGVCGTIFAPTVARIAKEAGALVVAISVMPFDCEGSRRARANDGLEHLKAAADGVVCLPNQKILKLTDENTSVLDTFKLANELLIEGLRGIWRLLTHRGLIEIHFADVCALLRDHHGESVFAVAESSGQNRSREAIEKLLAHPMLNGGQTLPESETVIVSLVGGPDMTMADVNRVMEQINRQCERAQVVMGAAIDEKFRDRFAITMIATQKNPEEKIEFEEEPEEPSQSSVYVRTKNSTAELSEHLLAESTVRPNTRIVPPAPESTPEKMEQLASADRKLPRRRTSSKMKQSQLPLEIISKGRFEKSQPTIHKGEDLDVPTYLRRGISLN